MIEIIWDEAFLRILKKWRKKHPELVERFQEKLSLFTNEPFHPSLKTHSPSSRFASGGSTTSNEISKQIN